MNTFEWVTVALTAIGICFAFYSAFKKGDLISVKLFVSPTRFKKGLIDSKFFRNLKEKNPAIGVINFLTLPKSNHKRICIHIYFTIQNPTDSEIENVSLVFTYPRKLCDENDKHFFKYSGINQKNEIEVAFIDRKTVQAKFEFKSIHPNSGRQIILPFIIDIGDLFTAIDVEDELQYYTKGKGFSFFCINYMVSGKRLKSPIVNKFWFINAIGNNMEAFFTKEKKFLNAISREFEYERYFFEIRKISKYSEGIYKKDVLAVDPTDLNIGYSSFPPLKEPFNSTFNFEKIE